MSNISKTFSQKFYMNKENGFRYNGTEVRQNFIAFLQTIVSQEFINNMIIDEDEIIILSSDAELFGYKNYVTVKKFSRDGMDFSEADYKKFIKLSNTFERNYADKLLRERATQGIYAFADYLVKDISKWIDAKVNIQVVNGKKIEVTMGVIRMTMDFLLAGTIIKCAEIEVKTLFGVSLKEIQRQIKDYSDDMIRIKICYDGKKVFDYIKSSDLIGQSKY